ncbi:MAG: ABC transporter permease [Propionivibrio sp.]|jgi:ribose transport system permease protein|uniref:ABC transporter permease n=1 Tax=Propionivibrio sp. TaxID=2212460 RepID=UPI001B7303BF|nr:ABC transporter permease [Propionivibrio sp.]MBP7202766.1 ABC transporter permease [Propionivibrio sp.]
MTIGALGINGTSLLALATKQKAFLAIVGMLVAMAFFPTNFYTAFNLLDMLNSTSILLILAFGVTLTVISGGCDLSIGGILVVAGIIAIKLLDVMPMWAAILCALAFGAFVGFINGFLVVQQKTEPFIITLGMGMLLTGVAQQLTDARPVPASNPDFMMIGNGDFFGVPYLVIIMLVCFAAAHWLMRYTAYGRNLYAIGGDYEVALYSGINVVRTKWMAFVISGMAAALAGVLLSSKLNTGSSIYGETAALIVNCGVVVGGTSFAGGIGGIPQSALGLLVFGILDNAMNMLGISSYIQILLKGSVIVGIIWMDCFYRKRKRELV